MQILVILGMYVDAAVVFVKNFYFYSEGFLPYSEEWSNVT